MLKLVRLEEKYRPQLEEMMEEWKSSGENIIPQAIDKVDYRDFDNYLESLEIKEATDQLVTDTTLFCLDTEENRFVGAVNIRHQLNDYLLQAGGHIGDGVRPSKRGKGIGTEMVALTLEECRRLGISRVLMCCSRDNIPSARTIQKNGGVLENEVEENGRIIQRYWIDLMTRSEKARQFFEEGYNCSQSVVLAFEDLFDMDRDTLLRLASPFGGGLGRLRQTCGCVSGMAMAAGVLYGYSDPKARDKKADLYALIQQLAAEFEKENGSINCRQLLSSLMGVPPEQVDAAPQPEARTPEYYKKRPCAALAASAAGILERKLEMNNG